MICFSRCFVRSCRARLSDRAKHGDSMAEQAEDERLEEVDEEDQSKAAGK